MEGNPGRAVEFLRWLRPGGPWVLTAIHPEPQRKTHTATFAEADVEKLEAWLTRWGADHNLYFMTNPALGPLTQKASKEEVESLALLHIDVDPPKGADVANSRAEILRRLQAFEPHPSAIVDSGGGYQAFWRLDEPLYVGGDLTRASGAEAYNQQLVLLLGGDGPTWNIDRVMRLPGTVNRPNAKKRAAGRTERVASVVELTDLSYPLSAFTPAQKVQAATAGGTDTRPGVVISGNLATVLIDDLPELVSLRTRMLIVQGEDPDDPTRYASRSEVVFAVMCEMVRAGCSDDVIAAVLLDPDYGVSAHVRAQRRPVEYAARQIQRAREHVEEPLLRVFNERHAVIEDIGGRCRVISEVMDEVLDRTRISKQSFDDFRNRYMHQRVQVGKKEDGEAVYKSAGSWWLLHPMRRQYRTMVFAPRREVEGAYNLWRGFACEAIPGRGHEPFLEHVRENICCGNEEHYWYLVRWMARAVQHPGEPGQVAVVLRGGEGTGKGTLINGFGSLWGRHFLHVSSAKHLVGQFNAHLRDCCVLFADEAFFAGDKQHESVLRATITEDTLVIEPKGVDAELAVNCIHLMMGSNALWVVPAAFDARRFFVLDVSEERKQDTGYFRAIRAALDSGGRESLLHYLTTLDISDFEVRDVPQTDALRDQKLHSLSITEQWWHERLMDGRITAQAHGWEPSILKSSLFGDYVSYAESLRVNRRDSPTLVGKVLSRVMPPGYPRSVQRYTDVEHRDREGRIEVRRERAYWLDLPPLDTCRACWDERYGGPFDWPTEDGAEVERGEVEDGDPY